MQDREIGPVWITKYALTTGITKAEKAELCLGTVPNGTMLMVPTTEKQHLNALYHKPDWHESREEAITRARQMRDAKILSLRKQLLKLEAMDFE